MRREGIGERLWGWWMERGLEEVVSMTPRRLVRQLESRIPDPSRAREDLQAIACEAFVDVLERVVRRFGNGRLVPSGPEEIEGHLRAALLGHPDGRGGRAPGEYVKRLWDYLDPTGRYRRDRAKRETALDGPVGEIEHPVADRHASGTDAEAEAELRGVLEAELAAWTGPFLMGLRGRTVGMAEHVGRFVRARLLSACPPELARSAPGDAEAVRGCTLPRLWLDRDALRRQLREIVSREDPPPTDDAFHQRMNDLRSRWRRCLGREGLSPEAHDVFLRLLSRPRRTDG